MKNITLGAICIFLLFSTAGFAQLDPKLVSLTIPNKLKDNANAVIRADDVTVTVKDIDLVIVNQDRIVTVFNETGMSNVNALEFYSDTRKIRDMKAVIYDALGNEIETIKERDFRDVSAVSGGTLYAENRVKYLEYTPRSFPITIHYTARVDYTSTAFLPRWNPMEDFYCSTEYSHFTVINPDQIPIRFKETNFEGFPIENPNVLEYAVSDLKALKNEAYRPDLSTYVPHVKLALNKFEMEGVEGINNTWSDFGKWMYDDLIAGTQELPEDVIKEVRQLTKDATTDMEKARLIYSYVQDRSRYISVQVGIGGWKPIDASEVHQMAYGDCKGLSNYTMALLEKVGVESNYAAIYGGRNKRSMDADFSMTEGNHAILYLPSLDDGKDYWLECTSKNAPFGFMSDFTDDRDALVITPEGGKIVHTTNYPSNENRQNTTGQFFMNQDGNVTGDVQMETTGVQYAWRNDKQHLTSTNLKKEYANEWDHLNGLSVMDVAVSNDKITPSFTETVQLEISNYGSKTGNLILFQPVILNRNNSEPPSYEDRLFDIEIDRGYVDQDMYEINLADGLAVDALPNDVELTSKFGSYSLKIRYIEQDNRIEIERLLTIKEGLFDKKDYQEFREFKSAIIKHDQSKGVLKINS